MIERSHGDILLTDNSVLDPQAQPLQDLLDHMIHRMAGSIEADVARLEKRLARIL